MLYDETDEQHPISMERIISNLAARDIQAERKSIYDDIDVLRTYGIDIALVRTKPGGYYLASRKFEIPEVKLLIDSVQASRFITEKKSLQLIEKLETLCSRHEAKNMHSQVYMNGRYKHSNESIYYNVDIIHEAIKEDRQVSFKYKDCTPDKKTVYVDDGKMYTTSPFGFVWNNENYYMIGYNPECECFGHYRVDRMAEIEILEEERQGKCVFAEYPMDAYVYWVSGSCCGDEMHVVMEFDNSLARTVFDRFGSGIPTKPLDDGHFRVTAQVLVNKEFYAWIFSLGKDAKIVSPPQAVRGMSAVLDEIREMYN